MTRPTPQGSEPAHPAESHTAITHLHWLPIRSLGSRQRPRILAHLLELDEHDRHLRFGHHASDSQIARYVDGLDFERDEVFGVYNRRLELVAFAHLAYLGADAGHPTGAEFGVSVHSRLRGRGIGARLFARACLHARNRSIDTLQIHALGENVAMLQIARQAGAWVEREGPDATAYVRLPADDWSSQLAQAVEVQAGEIDYGFKRQASRVEDLIDSVRGLVSGGRTPPQR